MDEKKGPGKNQPQIAATYGQMQVYQPDDEIDLRELWQTLRKRKSVVFITVVLFLSAAIIYILLAKPVYRAKATIEIGKQLIRTKKGEFAVRYFDNAYNLKRYIDVKYDTAGRYRKKGATAYIKKVSVNKKAAEFLTIIALGSNNATAVKILQKPLKYIYTKDKVTMKAILEKETDAAESIKRQIDYDTNVLLPQLKSSLNVFQTVEVKKIDDQIKFIKTKKIPTLERNIREFEKEVVDKEKSIKNMQLYIAKTAKEYPSFAAMTVAKISDFENSIANLKIQIVNSNSKIKILQYSTTPALTRTTNGISTLQYSTIPNLKAAKKHLFKETVPAKQASIKKIESVTIPQLKLKIKQIQVHMKAPYIVMTRIIGNIYTHNKPIKPRKKLIIVVALLTGLILGIFLTFFLEFIGKNNEIAAL